MFDIADVPVEKRQAVNDKADKFVKGLLQDSFPVFSVKQLPTWGECAKAIESGVGTPLHKLIYENEDLGEGGEAKFRSLLAQVLNCKSTLNGVHKKSSQVYR